MHAPAQPFSPVPRPVAPVWHTVLFLAALTGLSVWSARSHGLPRLGFSSRVFSYLLVMAYEWVLVGLVAWGVHLRGLSIRSLIEGRWASLSDFFRDLGLSISFLIFSFALLSVVTHLLRATPNENVKNLLPHGLGEKAVWGMVALTAGFCEELMVRGYLQKQFYGWFGNGAAAVLAQGIVFGAGHAYQGWKYMVMIALLGCMLGWLAQWRRSLRPGMMAHFIQDLIGGLAQGVLRA